jgi:hypothetical protein
MNGIRVYSIWTFEKQISHGYYLQIMAYEVCDANGWTMCVKPMLKIFLAFGCPCCYCIICMSNVTIYILVSCIISILFYFGWIIFGLNCDIKILVFVCCRYIKTMENLWSEITTSKPYPWDMMNLKTSLKFMFLVPFMLCHLDLSFLGV